MTNEYATKLLKRIQYGTTYPVYKALDMAIEALSSLPREGEWICEEQKQLDGDKWWKCSKCGYGMGFLSSKPSDKYCPMCGDKKER